MHQFFWVWQHLTLDIFSQSTIFLGALAVLFLGKGSRWGFVLGLLAQPSWYYTTYTHQQWVLFAASFVYTIGWGLGFYRTFIKKQETTTSA